MATGAHRATATCGYQDVGTARRTKALIGRTRTTTTTKTAGACTKATGTVKTTAITTTIAATGTFVATVTAAMAIGAMGIGANPAVRPLSIIKTGAAKTVSVPSLRR